MKKKKKKRQQRTENYIFFVLSHLQIHVPEHSSFVFIFFRIFVIVCRARLSTRFAIFTESHLPIVEHTCDTESHLPYTSIDVAYTITEIRTNTCAFVSVKTACRIYTLHARTSKLAIILGKISTFDCLLLC